MEHLLIPVYLVVACAITLLGVAWGMIAVWSHRKAAIVAAIGWTTMAAGTVYDALEGGHWYTGHHLLYLGGTGAVVLAFGLLALWFSRGRNKARSDHTDNNSDTGLPSRRVGAPLPQ